MKELLLAILILLGGFQSAFAACFVINKYGNVRSGPGMQYEIIGHVKEWQVIELPRGERWLGNWLCIENRERTKKEYIHKSLGRIVPGTSFDVRKQISVTKENKSWEKRSRDEFLKDETKIGMNKSQVWALWGRPDDINRTESASGIREQWIYGDTVLYFDNGELTSWQE